ncbi:hypothetical protein JQC92_08145 [Shewanella sp. 202IG2-18]|uniref:hypothetical protein n=1 Tax=Parashewanella hymeniacidonis TaxID=2807618 RepID=UPI00195F267B|nr:hypothetical protein [Parashewanella hymeniacidonis]MBM7071998.1 hypothetical protein [Parashewanella hymeniacidonis]
MLITYSEFCQELANQSHARSSIQNIYSFEFENLISNKNSDDFNISFQLKDEYKTQLKNDELRAVISDTLILNSCQQISKILLNRLHPETEHSRFFVTDQRVICLEPCF